MNYGSTGVGAANHLVAELFNSKAGLKMTHMPYRGTALAVGDLSGGQLTMVFGDPISVLPHIKSGKLRALAVTSLQRSPVAPEVPTVAESGYPGFEALAWHGILAPAQDAAGDHQEAQRGDREGAAGSRDQGHCWSIRPCSRSATRRRSSPPSSRRTSPSGRRVAAAAKVTVE